MLNKLALIGLMSIVAACQVQLPVSVEQDWQSYKERFVQADGRVVDTGNAGISHSEGQGFGMLLAVSNDDRRIFDIIWRWTRQHLQLRKDELFIWRRRPDTALEDEDMNNASDGDIIIAWALLQASQKWRNADYRLEADKIMQAIKQQLVIEWNGRPLLLPGAYGFQHGQSVEINLSYWIYPAFNAFNQVDKDPVWMKLTENGLHLLKTARFGPHRLPADWLALNKNHEPEPQRTARFGYDAVRIPLYLVWGGADGSLLKAFADYWQFYGSYTPAWVDLTVAVMDAHGASDGVRAIKQLTLVSQKRLDTVRFGSVAEQDYYAATLLLLSKICYRQIFG
ncbi:glycosyl hydrolase family 8 [Methylomarinum vadi]|uniref:glycosyl hydrolase family 8 n=1 Tax=Methylomarinum vadi TaxID=438855 RepID=UPI0004DFA9C7|nr:glycosyl hydrolase family 8 [Methylomarinum vadi]